MTIHVHVVCWNEERIMPWFLAHYSRFATRIFCHDNGSTDRTREVVAPCPIAELLEFERGRCGTISTRN
jgi:hypothetical protein